MTDRLDQAMQRDMARMSRVERELPVEFVDHETLRAQRITLCQEQPEVCFNSQDNQSAAA